ncbi:MAG: thiolase family protein [Sphingomonadales bacterium]|nr:thiolase family protein [Sphingomonadales bacterium]
MTSIIGVGLIPFGQYLNRTVESLGVEAALLAMKDAGVSAKQITGAYVANALGSRLFGDMTVGQSICAQIGVRRVPVINVENACASGSAAFHLAWQAIEAGQCDVAMVLGIEKMSAPGIGLINSGVSDPDTQMGMVTPAGFALRAKRHMYEFGTTAEQLAQVTVKSRWHAQHNPNAQFQKQETIGSVLAAPMIADPLTRSQCCPIADGAAAIIVCSDRFAKTFSRAVRVRYSVLTSGGYENPMDIVRWETDYRAAQLAYEGAGLGAEDLDVVECHDAFTIAEILHYEALGLCPPGHGGQLVDAGVTSLGGRIPVNVSGGLLSRGHPIAATAVAQLVELTAQLRHESGRLQVEGCRVGLAHCMGGEKAADAKSCTVVILSN